MRNPDSDGLDKASRLDDDQLAEQIAELESGKGRLRLPDERGRKVPLNRMFVDAWTCSSAYRTSEKRTRKVREKRRPHSCGTVLSD
jgi:hypothetical protein